ncbi:hypothetical protein [Moellerella wisconsensis]|uniref:Lipoprotein n=1 Tax=Moellerella wisconsensis ATCC 35017 TaxID=1354267 RepID=A0A0N0Z7Y3_9GAMM|nr:hypothetical protein [Moellerella wisconsensis]KPD02246.1 hypothetical protein M992_2241 [Moellerella wisconsensis ATCC 35017]VFS53900.1 Uncharacterised protein [Moellerella wisconsensis]
MKNIYWIVSLFLLSTSAIAQCDFKKVARNEVLEQKIGISGNCDSKKALQTQGTKKIDKSLDVDSQKIKNDGIEKKHQIEKRVNQTQKLINKDK